MNVVQKLIDLWKQRDAYPRKTRAQREAEAYLAKSVDLVDLERRQRELSRKGL